LRYLRLTLFICKIFSTNSHLTTPRPAKGQGWERSQSLGQLFGGVFFEKSTPIFPAAFLPPFGGKHLLRRRMDFLGWLLKKLEEELARLHVILYFCSRLINVK
jgi:hypothetical protein